MDDLDDHLAGRHGFDDRRTDSLLRHPGDEIADNIERDIGLEQRAAHFAHGFADVGLGERAAPAELVEYAGKAFLKGLEHRFPLSRDVPTQNAPEGAQRCRALTSDLSGRAVAQASGRLRTGRK